MLNLNKCTKTKHKPKPTKSSRTARMCMHITVHDCHTQYSKELAVIKANSTMTGKPRAVDDGVGVSVA